MSKEAMKRTVDKIKSTFWEGYLPEPVKCKYPKCSYPCSDLPDCRDAEQPATKAGELHAMKTELWKQPAQQEPVAWTAKRLWNRRELWTCPADIERDLVDGDTSPPAQRTWVGLEKSDMPDGADPIFDDPKFIAGMVYAANKLMEKNT